MISLPRSFKFGTGKSRQFSFINFGVFSLCIIVFVYVPLFTHSRGAVASVTLLDRMKGDAIDTPHHILNEWGMRPCVLIARYIKQELKKNKWIQSSENDMHALAIFEMYLMLN